jgi:hypothetical protein
MSGAMNVNGRRFYFQRLANLKRVSRSRWTVERNGLVFQIEGGRHAGGTRRDWFLDGPLFTGSIDCTSLVDALRLLEGM